MDESHSSLITAGLVTIFLAVISGCTAVVSRTRLGLLERQGEEGNRRSGEIHILLDKNRDNILTGLWVIHSFLLFYLGTIAMRFLSSSDAHWPATSALIFAVAVITGVIIPRHLLIINPEKGVLLFYPVILFTSMLLVPLIRFTGWILSPISNSLKPNREETHRINEQVIKKIVEEGREMGVLDEEEEEMITSIFDFGETIAREVMVPRVDMVCVDKNSTVRNLITVVSDSGFSRIPVYEDSVDRIVGIVYAKDILPFTICEKLDTPVSDIARKPPFFVPTTKKVDELLREMRSRSISIAIVVDEYGGTDGLISIEDILEEIVGEITDEHDEETPDIVQIEGDSYLVSAGTIIETVNDELDLDVPVEDQETIGGFVYGVLGHIPRDGEMVQLKELGVEMTVNGIKGQRITSLLIKKLKKDSDEESGDS